MSGRYVEGKRWIAHLVARAKVALLGAAFALCLAPAVAVGQGLPSADDLEGGEPVDEEFEPEEFDEQGDSLDEDAEGDELVEDAADDELDEEAGFDEEVAEEQGEDGDVDEEENAAQVDEELAELTGASEGADEEESDEDTGAHPLSQNHVESGINLEGARGFQHMTSAKPGASNTYHVGFLGNFTSGQNLIRYRDQNDFVAGNLLVEASLLEHLSANLGIRAANNVNSFGRPQAMLSQGDVHMGVRGHLNPQPGFYIAGDATAYMPTGFNSAGLDLGATSVRPRLLVSAELDEYIPPVDDYQIPLTAHFNVGYRLDNSSNLVDGSHELTRVERFAHGITGYDFLEFGLGLEYALPYVSPFMSWNLEAPVNPDEGLCADAALDCASEAGFLGFPNTLSLGARAEPVQNLGLTAGVDIGLTSRDVAGLPVTPPWQAVVGASWTIDPSPSVAAAELDASDGEESKEAFVLGTVTDAQTEEPIVGAIVRYLEPEQKTPQATDDEGGFHSYGFSPDKELVIEISHPEYETAEQIQAFDEEGEYELAVALEPAVELGLVSGAVTDGDGDPIPHAEITLTGPEVEQITADGQGEFEVEVATGDYVVAAGSDEYLTGGKDLAVDSDEEARADITLRVAPDERIVEVDEERIRVNGNIAFESGNDRLQESAHDVLDQVAAVLFETPNIERVRIESHTDDVGDEDYNMEISQERAESVRDYLLERGVGAERLDAQGLGESEPLVPNSNDRNRAMNRRVEFHIVEQQLDEEEPTAESNDLVDGEQLDEEEPTAESNDLLR